jgi:predicted DNA-binding transcriptional regulator AlpA
METANNTLNALLNEHDVARITGLSVATVRRWRLLRQGPRYLKLGALVRYRREDLAGWLASRPTGGSEIPPGGSENTQRTSEASPAISRRRGSR